MALLYAAAVFVVMSFSLWPDSYRGGSLLGMLLSLPWGLGVILMLDTIDPELVKSLGTPLVAMCGFLNAFLLYNLLRGAPSSPT